jgi:hypothetical protein
MRIWVGGVEEGVAPSPTELSSSYAASPSGEAALSIGDADITSTFESKVFYALLWWAHLVSAGDRRRVSECRVGRVEKGRSRKERRCSERARLSGRSEREGEGGKVTSKRG